jgi:hypothetical protein
MTIELVNPCGEFTHSEVLLAPRPGLRTGMTVGLFHNSKMNAETLLEDIAQQLGDRVEGLKFRRVRKESSEPANFSAGFLEECDVVVAALAD